MTGSNDGFSMQRVGIGFLVVIGVSVLVKLPGALVKNAGRQQELPQQQQANIDTLVEDLQGRVSRGEDVDDAILLLSGIDPEEYKQLQAREKFRQLNEDSKHEEAMAALDEGLEKYPEAASLHNAKAWFLATNPNDGLRNGELAVEHARQLCELTDSDANSLDTLAAALAEVGDFEAAVIEMEKAVGLVKDEAKKQRFDDRLAMYRNQEPFRE